MELRTTTPRVVDGAADADTTAWARAMLAAFLAPRPDPARLAVGAAALEGQRLRALHDGVDPSPVATLRSWDARMTVPGGEVAVDAVTSIAVRPTHRRRGLMRRLLDEDLAVAARAGTPVAALTSTQGSLYERFGFGAATWTRSLSVDTAAARFRDGAERGRVEIVTAPEAFVALASAVHERARRRHAGAIAPRPHQWEKLAGGAGMTGEPDAARHTAVWRDDDGLLGGYVVHRVESGWSPTGDRATLAVLDMQATTPRAYRELWRHLCGHDLVGTVRWASASVDEPLPWLLADHRAVTLGEASAMLWLRLLDLPTALTARTYPVADVLALHAIDPAGHVAGRWRLDTTDPTTPRVVRLDAAHPVDVEVGAGELASIYLGGVDPRVLARAGRLTEHTAGAAARLARVLGAPSVPWNGIRF